MKSSVYISEEDIVGVCCGGGWIAVYTDAGNVRLFTLSGLQLAIWTQPGLLEFVNRIGWLLRGKPCWEDRRMGSLRGK